MFDHNGRLERRFFCEKVHKVTVSLSEILFLTQEIGNPAI